MSHRVPALGATLTLCLAASSPGEEFRLPAPDSPAWEKVALPGVERPTDYRAIELPGEGSVVLAEARCAASALVATLPEAFSLEAHPVLRWRWRAEPAAQGPDERSKPGDDFAARVSVMFPLEPERTSWFRRLRNRLGSSLAGREVPGTALYFVWTRVLAPGSQWESPYGGEVQMFALARGVSSTWQEASVDVRQAYHQAFGRNPPQPVAVGLMTDSDNHCGHARAWVSDLRFTAPE